MKKKGLVSKYTVAQFKPQRQRCNDEPIQNELKRQFTGQAPYAVVVSDLTYVRVNYKWNYVCILVDLFNREIIGYSAGIHKDAQLVYDAFATVKIDLRKIQMFHSDRGSEFKNELIDEVITTFQIKRSLSMKGCPYDNAVAEAILRAYPKICVNSEQWSRTEQNIDWRQRLVQCRLIYNLTPAGADVKGGEAACLTLTSGPANVIRTSGIMAKYSILKRLSSVGTRILTWSPSEAAG